MEHEKLTERLIGAAIHVQRVLGPGFLEAIYEQALAVELCNRGVGFARQVVVPVRYGGYVVGVHRLDFFVERTVVVELRTVKSIDPVHYACVRSYLRAVGRRHGLILNFSAVPLDIRRVLAPGTARGVRPFSNSSETT